MKSPDNPTQRRHALSGQEAPCSPALPTYTALAHIPPAGLMVLAVPSKQQGDLGVLTLE